MKKKKEIDNELEPTTKKTKVKKSLTPEVTKTKKTKAYLTKKEALEYHNDMIELSEDIEVEEEGTPCFKFLLNTSGTVVLLPDFRALDVDPDSQKVIKVDQGQAINLSSKFSNLTINRNRESLLQAFKMKGMHGFPMLTCVEKLNTIITDDKGNELSFNPLTIVKKALQKGMKNEKVDAGYNEYDEKLEADYKKEEDYNKRIMQKAGQNIGNRRTQEEAFNSI